MIEQTNIDGRRVVVAASAIVRITETGVSSKWHGINSIVKTSDGITIECKESVDHIIAAMQTHQEQDHA